MSRNVVIQIKESLTSEEIKEKLGDLFIKVNGDDEFLLQYMNKWIWFFFEDVSSNIYDIEFSGDFTNKEESDFIQNLRHKIEFNII